MAASVTAAAVTAVAAGFAAAAATAIFAAAPAAEQAATDLACAWLEVPQRGVEVRDLSCRIRC